MINDYVILVGLGEIGVSIFKKFVVLGNDVELTAIDNSYNRVMLMNDYVKSKNSQSVDLCILGDPRDQNTLINAGLKRCTRLILALDEDADNFAVAQTVKRVIENFSEDEKKIDIEITCIVSNNENKDLFSFLDVQKTLGISDNILNIVNQISRPSLPINILDIQGTDNAIFTIKISSDSKSLGKKVLEIRVPFKIIYLGIIDSYGNCQLVNSDTVLNDKDMLILSTSNRHQNLLNRYF
ncbi:MAG: hypothetical protein CL764_03530 [Chloroflexi bacterium]|nr:hypothetical protein [Chloroflexota bacterium]